MTIEFGRATTAAEIAAVQGLRYAVYVDEMDRYHDVDGSEHHRFAEPEDEHSWLFYARDGDTVVASTRLSWGGDGFSPRQIDQYQLTPFLAEIPAEFMAVGERNSVLPAYRGTGVVDEMLAHSAEFMSRYDLRLVFGCCEPHLLSMYLKMGQQAYAAHNINSPAAGYLIPLVSFLPDVDGLRGLGPSTPPGDLPGCVEAVLARGGTVRSEALSEFDEYWADIRSALARARRAADLRVRQLHRRRGAPLHCPEQHHRVREGRPGVEAWGHRSQHLRGARRHARGARRGPDRQRAERR